MVERALCMREVEGSKPFISIILTLTAIFMFCPKRNRIMLRGFESRRTYFTKGVYPSGQRRFTTKMGYAIYEPIV